MKTIYLILQYAYEIITIVFIVTFVLSAITSNYILMMCSLILTIIAKLFVNYNKKKYNETENQ